MSNFRKFISMSAVAVLAGTNLLAPLSYADAAAIAWASLVENDFTRNPLEFQMPDSDVYLYAITEPNNYYVAFQGNTHTSGEMGTQHFVYDENKALSGNAYAKTGFTFSGWNTDANGSGTSYDDEDVVVNLAESGTVNLYAQWNEHSYIIHYDLNDIGGSSSGEHTKTPASGTYTQALTIANATRQGYNFSGWNITGMDTNPHTVGGEASSAATANNVMGTSFSKLTAENGGTVNFIAQWSAKLTPYTVEHYQETLTGGVYPSTATLTENLSGYTDDTAIHAPQEYAGFGTATVVMEPENGKIDAYGNTVITYKYPRNPYILTIDFLTGVASVTAAGEVAASETFTDDDTKSFKFDEPVTLTATLKTGYTGLVWGGYSGANTSFNMPAEAATKTVTAAPIDYTITYYTRGGTVDPANPAIYTVETPTFTLTNPTRGEYSRFSGWIGGVDGEITVPTTTVTIPSESTENRTYTAVWDCVIGYHIENTGADDESCEADTSTKYHVNHLGQDLSGDYTYLITGYDAYGTTNTMTEVTGFDNIEGFTLSGVVQVKINGEGTSVVNAYYNRDSYSKTIADPVGAEPEAITSSSATATHPDGEKIKYYDTVTLSAELADGYEFDYWEVKDENDAPVTVTNSGDIDAATFTMPASAVTITPHLKQTPYGITYVLNSGSVEGTPNPISYTVESENIYLTDPTRDHSVFLGWSGGGHDEMFSGHVVAIAKGSTGSKTFTANWGCETGYHPVDNSCEANTYTATIDYNDGGDTPTGTADFEYDTGTIIPNPQQSGYTFIGWTITGLSGDAATVDGEDLVVPTSTGVMGTVFKNLTPEDLDDTIKFTAQWEPDDVTYTVYHYTKVLGEDTYSLEGAPVTHTGKSAAPVNFNTITGTYEGFTYTGGLAYTTAPADPTSPSGARQPSTTIDKHGNTKIYLYYDRNKWTVTTAHDSGVNNVTGDGTYEYGADVHVEAHVKTGYHFVQWTGTPANAPTGLLP